MKKKKPKTSRVKKTWQVFKHSPLLVNATVSLVAFSIIFVVLIGSIFSGRYRYESGHVANENIYLEEDIVDEEATNQLYEKRRAEVTPVMYVDFSKLVNSKKELTDFFSRLREVKATYKDEVDVMKRIYAGIERKNSYKFTESELMELAGYSTERLKTIENYAIDITSQKMISGITRAQIEESYQDIEQYMQLQELPETDKLFVLKFIKGALTENLLIDEDKTAAKVDEVFEKVEPVKLKAGTLLVSEGQAITDKTYALLKESGMLIESSKTYWSTNFILLAYLLGLWLVLHFFLWGFDPSTLKRTKRYGILMSLFIFAFLTSGFFYNLSPYAMPVTTFIMLVSIMLSPVVAFGSGTMLLILIQAWNGLDVSLTLAYLVTLFFGAILMRNIKQRTQIMACGLMSALVLALFSMTHTFVLEGSFGIEGQQLLYALSNGVISAVLTIGIMPFYEVFFGVLTPFKLLELSNPNKPLLKRLLIEAPGTYHHSILVGNLAETAAHDIHANSLLTRVAAFYHDVGKLDRPFYFKENQISGDNPHDKLPPQVSANIIREHMTHGAMLCEKNKLPKEIVDVIKAHHGTSLIKYFYYEEQKNNPDVDISKFVYPGPKPKSKEAVILMLADSTEAAVRTLENPTREKLSDLIDKIVSQKIEEKQFTEAVISLKEIEAVKSAFIHVLNGIFHERIVYPEIDLKNISKASFDEAKENQ